jgi:hypothetical protein
MADINAIAKQFIDFYYTTFDANRANLAPLYVRHLSISMLITLNSALTDLYLIARTLDALLGGNPNPGCNSHHRKADGTCAQYQTRIGANGPMKT